MLFRGISCAFAENRTKHMNTICWQSADFVNVTAEARKVTTVI
jgi:hypothetical protein